MKYFRDIQGFKSKYGLSLNQDKVNKLIALANRQSRRQQEQKTLLEVFK